MANSAIPYIVNDLIYDGSQLTVTWTPSSDNSVTAYVVSLSSGHGDVLLSQTFTMPWSSSTQPITQTLTLDNGALDINKGYYVTVSTMWGSSPGQNETSQPVTLITQLPELLQSYYDGSEMWFEWIPTPQAVQGYILQVTNGTQTFFNNIPSPSASSGSIPSSLLQINPSLSTTVSLSAAGYIGENNGNGGQVLGQSATLTLPTGLPALTVNSAVYQTNAGTGMGSGAVLNVGWTALATAAGIASYQLVIASAQDAASYVINVPSAAAANGAVPLPAGLSPSVAYTLRVIALNASGGGVSSALIPLVTSIPQLNSVVYSASANTLSLGWNTLANTSLTYNLAVAALVGSGTGATGTAAAGAASGTITLPTGGLVTTAGWAAQVAAVSGVASAVSSWAPVYPAAPTVQQVSFDGSNVTLTWTPLANTWYQPPAGYLISMTPTGGGAAIASVFISSSQASSGKLALPPGTTSCNVQITAANGFSSGPASTAVAPILAAPVLSGVTSDPILGQSTLTWSTVTGAASYALEFNNGAVTASAATNSYAVPATTLSVNAPLSVVLTASGTSGGAAVTGPSSKSFVIPTAQPLINFASYNGSSATVSWNAVPGASTYTVTVLGTTGSTTTSVAAAPATAELSTSLAFTAVSGTVYTTVVQANMGSNVGPASVAASLFGTAWFVSQSNAATIYPFVYPATLIGTVLAADSAKTGEAVTVYLPQIAGGSGLTNPSITQNALSIAANTGTGSAQYPYTLTISNTAATNNPWSFGFVAPATSPAAIRDGLRADYIAFLQALETNGALPWGVQYVQQILGRLLPQTFAELLYYNYGLSYPDATAGITVGSVDLRPGMTLRIAASPFQMVPGQTSSASSWLDGFVGGPMLDYDFGSAISNAGSWGTGFDAFISQLVLNGAMSVTAPQMNRSNNIAQGAADVADLYGYPAFSGPFYRMFVPANLMAATNNLGSLTISDNFALAPATSYTNLSATTNTLAPSGNNVLAYFRGRAVLRVCIRISVNGIEKLVPIGTTLGNLLEQSGGMPAMVAGGVQNVLLERNVGGAVINPGSPLYAANYYPVRLDWSNSGAALYGAAWGPMAMPLLAGDRVSIAV